jgi:hypothetical protein
MRRWSTKETVCRVSSTPFAWTVAAFKNRVQGPCSMWRTRLRSTVVALWMLVVSATPASAQFFNDTFTDNSGLDIVLSSHTPEIGGSWVEHPSYPDDVFVNATAIHGTSVSAGVYYNTASPASADYSVQADIVVIDYQDASCPGVVGRVDPAADTLYRARYHAAFGYWELVKHVAGSETVLGTFSQILTNYETYTLKLEMIGTAIKVYVDGAPRISVTDSSISAAGKAGITQVGNEGQQVTSVTASPASGQFLVDLFADHSGQLVILSSHAPETGGPWVEHPSYPDNLWVFAGDLKGTGGGAGVYYNTASPASADYSVQANIMVYENSVASYPGVVGRVNPTADTLYVALYHQFFGYWELAKHVAGSETVLGTFSQTLTDSQTYTLKLEMIGTAIKVYVDGVPRISVTDSSISAAGKAGVLQVGGIGQQVTSIAAMSIGGGGGGISHVSCSSEPGIVYQQDWAKGIAPIAMKSNGAFYRNSVWSGPDAVDSLYPEIASSEAVTVTDGGGPAGENVLDFNPAGAASYEDYQTAGAAFGGFGSIPDPVGGASWWDATAGCVSVDYKWTTAAWDQIAYAPLLVLSKSLFGPGPGGLSLAANISGSQGTLELGYTLYNANSSTKVSWAYWDTYPFTRATTENQWQQFAVMWRNGSTDDAVSGVASDGWVHVYWNGTLIYDVNNIPLIMNPDSASALDGKPNRLRTLWLGYFGLFGPTTNLVLTSTPCVSTVSNFSVAVPSAGLVGESNGVVAPAGCAWSANSPSSFVHVTAGASGTGNGTVTFSVDQNTSSEARSGEINIGGHQVIIAQAGNGFDSTVCEIAVSASMADPQSGTVTVDAPSDCAWTAQPLTSQVTVSESSGTGSATVGFQLDPSWAPSSTSQLSIGPVPTVLQVSAASGGICFPFRTGYIDSSHPVQIIWICGYLEFQAPPSPPQQGQLYLSALGGASVVRGQSKNISLTPLPLPPGAKASNWRFEPDTASLGTVRRTANREDTKWQGVFVTKGKVRVTVMRGVVDISPPALDISVEPRSGWAWTPVTPQKKDLTVTQPIFTTPGGRVLNPPNPPDGSGYIAGASGLDMIFSPLPGNATSVSDNGPNRGYKYLSQTLGQSRLINNVNRLTAFYWVMAPDVENLMSDFSRKQCNAVAVGTSRFVISGLNLKNNTERHESGNTQSHFQRYRDFQNVPENNLGSVAEQTIGGKDTPLTTFTSSLDSSLTTLINTISSAAFPADEAVTNQPYGVNFNANGQDQGDINFWRPLTQDYVYTCPQQ